MSRSWLGRSRLAARALGLGAALCAGGCTPGAGAQTPGAAPASSQRRPPAIAVDLPGETPEVQDDARAEQGIVSLRTPLGVDAAKAVVRVFFQAVAKEDLGALSNVVSAQAQIHDLGSASAAGGSPSSRAREALNFWSQRFRQQDYGQLGTEPVYRESDVEVFEPDARDALPPRVRSLGVGGAAERSPAPLVLRVPLLVPSVKSQRLFGSEIFFWLERQQDRYVVIQLAETFPY